MRSLLLVLFVVSFAASGSLTAFETVVGGPALDRGVFVSPTSDGGYVVVGATRSYGAGEDDVYLVKTDRYGTIQWSRTYGGSGEDLGWSVHEVDGGFVVAGFTSSFGNGGYDFYLVKTDSAGEMLWSKTFGGEEDDRAWALALAPDGGFALLGETKSSGAGEEDCLLVRTDASGEELWSRTYGGSRGDRCFSIARSTEGGFLLAGQTYSEGAGDRDAYVVKVGPKGVQQWSKTFGGAASDVGHSVVRLRDGSFLVTGYTTSLAFEDDDPYLIKIDARGQTLWTRVIPIAGSAHTLTGDQAADGGFCLAGFLDARETRSRAGLLVKTDAEGRFEWQRDILRTISGETFGYTVRAVPNGGCVLTGHTTVGSAGHYDLLLVAVDDDETVSRSAIEAASRAFSDAYVRNDVEALNDLYTKDALLLPPGREVRGRDAAGEYFRWRGNYRQIAHAMTSEEVVVRGDTAIDVGTWYSTGQRGEGEPSAAEGRYLIVWVRESDGQWRMRYDMWHRPQSSPQDSGAED